MVTRELPPEEWYRLADYPIMANGPLDPSCCRIVVVENEDGDIVGVWSAMTAVWVEGLWVAEPYRKKSTVAGRLLAGMKGMLQYFGVRQCFTFTQTEYVAGLAMKAGFEPLPGQTFVLQLDEVKN